MVWIPLIILGFILEWLPYAAGSWALVELAMFIFILVKPEKFKERFRKITYILFPVSVLSIGIAILLGSVFKKVFVP